VKFQQVFFKLPGIFLSSYSSYHHRFFNIPDKHWTPKAGKQPHLITITSTIQGPNHFAN
jgi:hypothetical protein